MTEHESIKVLWANVKRSWRAIPQRSQHRIIVAAIVSIVPPLVLELAFTFLVWQVWNPFAFFGCPSTGCSPAFLAAAGETSKYISYALIWVISAFGSVLMMGQSMYFLFRRLNPWMRA